MSQFQMMQGCIDAAVMANRGRAFINANTVATNGEVRIALELLANAAGLPKPKEQGLSSERLAMLYATARKDMHKAANMALAWADETSAPPPPPAFDPILDPAPPPAAPSAAPFDLEAVLEAARKEASAMADYIAKDRLEGAREALAGLVERVAGEAAAAAIASLAPVQVTVTSPAAPDPVALGVVHETTPLLLRLLTGGSNVYLYGPAGSGKTTAGQIAAKAFGLPFYFTGKIDSEYLLLGFVGANGHTVRTQFREAYEHGGVFLFDEVDRSAPSAFTALNAALANKICAFPDGVIPMHPDFKCIAAGNTRMNGADNTYTAGQQQDASSIDRFAFVSWQYDEKLERALCPNKAWCEYVIAMRAQVAARGINHLISPRASYEGARRIGAGLSWDEAASAFIFKGLDDYIIEQLREAVPVPSAAVVELVA